MSIVREATITVPVTSYQVNLSTAGGNATLTHPRNEPVLLAATDELALWCAGSEMLTTITVRLHDQTAASDVAEPMEPVAPAAGAPDAAEETTWLVTRPGQLLAHALDYGATSFPGLHLSAGSWTARAAVWNRPAASELDDRLADEDEDAAYGHARVNDQGGAGGGSTGPQAGPEVWVLDLRPGKPAA